MVTTRDRKTAGKAARKTVRKVTVKPKAAKAKSTSSARKIAKAKPVVRKAVKKATPAPAAPKKKVASKPVATAAPAKPAKPASRPASVKTAAQAVAAARASAAAKRRPPSYIPRSRFNDDWLLGGSAELPRQPNPAAHTPTRKPPKPRAPKPKAISHEQAVANLKALLDSRKRKDRGDGAAKNA